MIKNLIGMRREGEGEEGEEGEDTNNICLEILVVPLSDCYIYHAITFPMRHTSSAEKKVISFAHTFISSHKLLTIYPLYL